MQLAGDDDARHDVRAPATWHDRIQDLVARFEAGDYLGALAVSDDALDPGLVVTLASTPAVPWLTDGAARLVTLVDERAPRPVTVEELVYESEMSMIDALRALCAALDAGALCVSA